MITRAPDDVKAVVLDLQRWRDVRARLSSLDAAIALLLEYHTICTDAEIDCSVSDYAEECEGLPSEECEPIILRAIQALGQRAGRQPDVDVDNPELRGEPGGQGLAHWE